MRGPQIGDKFSLLHSCANGTCLAEVTAELVTKLSSGYRITASRCDGRPVEFTVDGSGHDRHGYVLPAGRPEKAKGATKKP